MGDEIEAGVCRKVHPSDHSSIIIASAGLGLVRALDLLAVVVLVCTTSNFKHLINLQKLVVAVVTKTLIHYAKTC